MKWLFRDSEVLALVADPRGFLGLLLAEGEKPRVVSATTEPLSVADLEKVAPGRGILLAVDHIACFNESLKLPPASGSDLHALADRELRARGHEKPVFATSRGESRDGPVEVTGFPAEAVTPWIDEISVGAIRRTDILTPWTVAGSYLVKAIRGDAEGTAQDEGAAILDIGMDRVRFVAYYRGEPLLARQMALPEDGLPTPQALGRWLYHSAVAFRQQAGVPLERVMVAGAQSGEPEYITAVGDASGLFLEFMPMAGLFEGTHDLALAHPFAAALAFADPSDWRSLVLPRSIASRRQPQQVRWAMAGVVTGVLLAAIALMAAWLSNPEERARREREQREAEQAQELRDQASAALLRERNAVVLGALQLCRQDWDGIWEDLGMVIPEGMRILSFRVEPIPGVETEVAGSFEARLEVDPRDWRRTVALLRESILSSSVFRSPEIDHSGERVVARFRLSVGSLGVSHTSNTNSLTPIPSPGGRGERTGKKASIGGSP